MSKPKETLTESEKKLLHKPIGWVEVTLYDDGDGWVAYAGLSKKVSKKTILDLCMGALAEERKRV